MLYDHRFNDAKKCQNITLHGFEIVRIHKGGHVLLFYDKFIELILFKAHFIKQVILLNISLLLNHMRTQIVLRFEKLTMI